MPQNCVTERRGTFLSSGRPTADVLVCFGITSPLPAWGYGQLVPPPRNRSTRHCVARFHDHGGVRSPGGDFLPSGAVRELAQLTEGVLDLGAERQRIEAAGQRGGGR